jgi:hypothetical protein
MEMITAIFCLLLVVAGLIIGCGKIAPGHIMRWPIYGLCSCFVVGGIWLNLLPVVGFSVPSPGEQIVTMLLVTAVLKWFMENFIGYWL